MLNNQMVLWAVVGNSEEMSWLLATFRKLILSGLSLFFILKDLHFCEDWVILSLSGKHLSMMKMMVMVMMMMVMAMMVMMVVMVQMECGNLTPAPTRIHETPPPGRTDLPRNESWTVDSNSWRRSWRDSTPLDIPTMTTRRTRPEAVTLQGLPMDGQRGFASNIENCSCGSRTLKRVSHRHPWLHNHGPMARKNARPQDPLVFQWLHESGFLDLQVQGMKKILQKLDIQTPGWPFVAWRTRLGVAWVCGRRFPPWSNLRWNMDP